MSSFRHANIIDLLGCTGLTGAVVAESWELLLVGLALLAVSAWDSSWGKEDSP